MINEISPLAACEEWQKGMGGKDLNRTNKGEGRTQGH